MAGATPQRSFTTPDEVKQKISTLRTTFQSGLTKSRAWRKWQLKQLWWLIVDNEARIAAALTADLNRHPVESMTTDILGLKQDVLDHIQHLDKWTADKVPDGAGFLMGRLGRARIRQEPLGLALIIGAWNFPFLLTLQPLVAAIAAGCTVIIKPSELAAHSEQLIVELVAQYLDPSAITVVTGGAAETGQLLTHKFDQIFFTGSAGVARHVAAAGARHLTPLVLELGGQGAAIVTRSANVDLAAKRIASAKFINAGQICLSVNHVFVDQAVKDTFIARLIYWNDHFRAPGNDTAEPSRMSNIINRRHHDRLQDLLQQTKGEIVYGGTTNSDTLAIEPTVVCNVDLKDSLLSQELFGPILPVIIADSKSAVRHISEMPHSLALYVFSNDQSEIDYILDNTLSGGVTINDVLLHATVHGAPFGGVGESGYGYYHGRYGLEAFSHKRIIVGLPTWLDKVMAFRYPPYQRKNLDRIRVVNRLGFRRGESISDQEVGNGPRLKVFSLLLLCTSLLASYTRSWTT